MSDDEIIGLKSTSIRFKENLKLFYFFVLFNYGSFNFIHFQDLVGINVFTFLLILFYVSLFYQILNLNKLSSQSFLKMFKLNNFSGLILFSAILSINLI